MGILKNGLFLFIQIYANFILKELPCFPDLSNFRLKNMYLAMANVPDVIEWARDHGLLTRVMIFEDVHCVGRNETHLENKAGVESVIWRCSVGRACRKKILFERLFFFLFFFAAATCHFQIF